jgi:YVTN family beta-propeller protein
VGRGAADPAGLAVTPDGKIIVALAGVDEVFLDADGKGGGQRLAVGKRPTTVALAPGGRRAYVANTFSDSISIIDLAQGKVEAEIFLGAATELSKIDRGEMLFHSARLTHDGWFSCHSCHTDGHSSGRRSDTLGDGTYGTPKRAPSLLGVGATGPWAWNGSMPDLATQVRQSVQKTMHGPKPTEEQAEELVAYLQSLAAPPPLGRRDAGAVRRGAAVFAKQSCGRCHTPPAYTSPKTYDVGLADEAGGRQFNPPSLRGVSQSGPYFHDGRAATLEEVFTHHRHQLEGKLTENELHDLLTFLRSL